MTGRTAIQLQQISKYYDLYAHPQDRLKQMLLGRWRQYGNRFWALHDTSLQIEAGEVVGLVGRNGAGKSTLLQLVVGTVTPSTGKLDVNGRIAALLELGAGFSPEFTGRENIFMNAAILGLGQDEIRARYDDIVAFSGIGEFIDRPVRTYSSGMYVRLAFSIAVHVEPEILVVDEALSVGDGVFARKSFDRIMELRDKGKTILFCSHSMYHVEALCERAIWLDRGQVMYDGPAPKVVNEYGIFLASQSGEHAAAAADAAAPVIVAEPGKARLTRVEVTVDGRRGKTQAVQSSESTIAIRIGFVSDPALPCPSVAVGFIGAHGAPVTSAGSQNDGVTLQRDANGAGEVVVEFPAFALLKGTYSLNVFLMCERGLLIYDHVEGHTTLEVSQHGLEQGVVTLPRNWSAAPA
ncbi:MAG: ABC transporter ATP-binding protein [Burkholderiales bacterium]|nr:ABC transporter ATP-binding protein [Burkholderiales bacterium]